MKWRGVFAGLAFGLSIAYWVLEFGGGQGLIVALVVVFTAAYFAAGFVERQK